MICPSRNSGAFIRQAIVSVLEQDYPRIELIVVDGESTDSTSDVLTEFGEQLRVICEPDNGQGDAINKGMTAARGDVLAWLNADDEYLPGAISAAVARLTEDHSLGMVYGDAIGSDGWGRRYSRRSNVSAGTFEELVSERCFIVQPSSFWRKEVWEQCGPLRTEMHYALDYEFFMRVAKEFPIAYEPTPLSIERLHSAAKTFSRTAQRIEEIETAAALHGGTGLPTAFRPEAAGSLLADGLRSLVKGDVASAKQSWSDSQPYRSEALRTAVFTGVFLGGPKLLPRARLYADAIVAAPERLRTLVRERPTRLEVVQSAVHAATRLPLVSPRLGRLRQYSARPVEVGRPYVCSGKRLPSISMVTPSFNQAEFLGQTIDSVLGQEYPDLEYMVCDGGSTDGSADVLAAQSHPSISWVSESDGGQANAINRGFAQSTGEVLGWLNSDDLLLPDALLAIGDFFSSNPDVDVVYGHRVLIDRSGAEIGRWVLPRHSDRALKWADYVPQETVFWRRSAWEAVGGLDESFSFALDWDLLLRFEQAGCAIRRVPRFLGCFRVYDEQLTSSALSSVGSEEMERLRHRLHERPVSQAEVLAGLSPYFAEHLVLHGLWRLGLVRY